MCYTHSKGSDNMKYSTKTYSLLKTMYKGGGVNRNQFPTSELHRLFQDHYITNSTNYHDENVYLTEEGRAHVEEVKLDKRRFWIPVVISILALLIASASLIVDIYQLANANAYQQCYQSDNCTDTRYDHR